MSAHTLAALQAGQLAGARELKLSCGLERFPDEIFSLAETLEVLDLSGNALDSLPDAFPQLRRLRVLFCSNNQFTRLPAVLGRCAELSMVGFKANRIAEVPTASLPPRLRWLILTDNAVEALPDEIGRCPLLQKLMLAGNRLSALPETLQRCERLELLRIAANRLHEFPAWLLGMPRLAWLAPAGNPFGAAQEVDALEALSSAGIAWSDLVIETLLGEGASGLIYRAHQRSLASVAVKLFKGAVTSDGLPRSEMAAALRAGPHGNLIPIRGQLLGHPEGRRGLVMDLIDPGYRNLAGPPSLESCTRDVYPADLRFEAGTVLRLVRGVASAAAHLHGRGILHGDLYAHNTLYDAAGHPLIGDFGAASLYVPDGGAQAQGLQRLEVLAFGNLLTEVLERGPEGWRGKAALAALQVACCDESPARRPLFEEILAALPQQD